MTKPADYTEEPLHPCFLGLGRVRHAPEVRAAMNLAAGKALQKAAKAKMSAERAALLSDVRRAMRELYREARQPVTTDDVRDWMTLRHPGWDAGGRQSWLATVFAGEKGWENVGYIKSCVASNRARRIGAYVWRG